MGEMMAMEYDPLLDWMRDKGIPLTRENYLEAAFLGEVPEDLDEERLPEQFRRETDGGGATYPAMTVRG